MEGRKPIYTVSIFHKAAKMILLFGARNSYEQKSLGEKENKLLTSKYLMNSINSLAQANSHFSLELECPFLLLFFFICDF